jgi:hypothetical protein
MTFLILLLAAYVLPNDCCELPMLKLIIVIVNVDMLELLLDDLGCVKLSGAAREYGDSE